MNSAPRPRPQIAWWWIVIVGLAVPVILAFAEQLSSEPFPDFMGIVHMAFFAQWTLLTLICVVVVVALRLFHARASVRVGATITGLFLQLLAATYLGYVLLITPHFPTVGKLFRSAAKGDVEYVKRAIEWGIEPIYHDSHSSHTSSVLTAAAKYGHNEIVTFLLDYGMDPNQDLGGSESPLMQAIWSGHADTARLLISRGADPTKVTDAGTTLHAVATTANTQLADELIAHGCKINSTSDAKGWTPLHRAVLVPEPTMMKHLVAKGADPTSGCGWCYANPPGRDSSKATYRIQQLAGFNSASSELPAWPVSFGACRYRRSHRCAQAGRRVKKHKRSPRALASFRST